MSAWTVIDHEEVGSGGAASIEFTSIPQTYTDLVLVLSLRTTTGTTWSDGKLEFNNVTSGYSTRTLFGSGSTASSITETVLNIRVSSNANTASTFGNQMVYIPNYTSSNQKSVSIDQVTENNATQALQAIYAGLSDITSAITSLKVTATSGTSYAQYSSATLFGVTKGSSGGVTVS